MSNNFLEKLIALVSFDQEFVQVQHQIAQLEGELEKDKKEIDTCQIGLERTRESKKEARKEVDSKELEMSMLNEQEKDKRIRLEKITNQREYQSINKEIEQLKKKQQELEEGLLEAWKKLEHAEQDEKQKKEFCDKKVVALDAVAQEKMKNLNQLQEKLAQYQNQRGEKLQEIPQDWLAKYKTMYQHVANPIVPIKQGSCSACFYPATQQDLADLKRGLLLQCKDCFRLLYFSA